MTIESERSPRLGVAVMVNERTKLLLIRRGKQPNYGMWVLPGGGVKFGEPWREAARREVQEETGLEIKILKNSIQPYIVEVLGDQEHRVILCVTATVKGGILQAGSDALEARFFYDKEIPVNEVSPVVQPILKEFGWL